MTRDRARELLQVGHLTAITHIPMPTLTPKQPILPFLCISHCGSKGVVERREQRGGRGESAGNVC